MSGTQPYSTSYALYHSDVMTHNNKSRTKVSVTYNLANESKMLNSTTLGVA